jgi:quercetin dioxygenase-like cupin family protein
MSPNLRTAETAGGHVIENPLSGERITIRTPDPRADGSVLDWELVLAPGGRVPSSHAHPRQEESFTVIAGRMRFRVRGRRVIAGPGETVRVPPGTVHHFANAGRQPARVAVRTRPALSMQELLETAAAMATEQHAAARWLPRPLELALFMREFEREVRAPYLPAALVGAVIRPLAWLARRRGLDGRYRRLRDPSASQPSASQPSASQPSASQPSASQPSASQPSASQPSASQPAS